MPANGITRLYNGTHLSLLAPKAFSNSPLLSDGVQLSHKNWAHACFFFLLSSFFLCFSSFFIFLLFLLPSDHPDPPSSFRQVSVGHDSVTLEWIPGFNGGLQQRFRIRWKSQETMSDEQGWGFFRSLKELYLTNCFGWQVLLGSVCQFPVCGCLPSQWDNLYCYWSAACHHLQLLCQCP